MDVAALRIAIQTGDIQKAQRELDKLVASGKGAEKATDSLNLKAVALGATFVAIGAGVVALIKKNIDLADSTLKAAQAAGISVETFSKYSYVADLAGVSTQELGIAFAQLSKSMSNNDDSFRRIGVSVKDASGKLKDSETVIADIADRFEQLPDGAEKTSIAMDLFGRSGTKLIPLLNQGSAGIKDITEEAEKLGIVLDTKTAMAAEQFNDNLTRASVAVGSIGKKITADLLPPMVEFSTMLVELSKNETALTTTTDVLNGALGVAKTVFQTLAVVGSDVGFVFLSVGREIGAWAAQIAAVSRGDFKGFKAISEAVKADGERARKELDAFQERIMNLGTTGTAVDLKVKTGIVGPSKEQLDAEKKESDRRAKEAEKRAKELASAELDIFYGKNAEIIAAADAAYEADFEAAKKLADEQIKFNKEIEDERIKMQRQRIMDESDARFKAIEEEERAQKKLTDSIKRDLTSALARAFESGKDPAAAFAQGLASTIFSRVSAALADALITGAMNKMGGGGGGTDIFGSLLSFGSSLFGGVGTAMQFGTNIGSQQTAMLSAQMAGFEGGGFTGSGSRSGGMDGRGGFMAMLHPNETVIDHAKGGGSGQIVYAPVIQIDSRTDRGEVMRLVQNAVQNGNNQLVDRLQRQGRI